MTRDFFFGLEVTGADEVTLRCDRNALTALFQATHRLGNDASSEHAGAALQIASCIQDCILFQLPKRGE